MELKFEAKKARPLAPSPLFGLNKMLQYLPDVDNILHILNNALN
jgi:hypothetical protein